MLRMRFDTAIMISEYDGFLYRGNQILPRYMGICLKAIMIRHDDSYEPTNVRWNS